jgi:hypothetical protein
MRSFPVRACFWEGGSLEEFVTSEGFLEILFAEARDLDAWLLRRMRLYYWTAFAAIAAFHELRSLLADRPEGRINSGETADAASETAAFRDRTPRSPQGQQKPQRTLEDEP